MSELVEIAGLRVSFGRERRPVVDGVSFDLSDGECLAIVGESGSGKSVTARSIIGLAGRSATVEADALVVAGRDRRAAGEDEWRRLRGGEVGLVLQDALTSIDPLRPVGREIADALRIHERMSHSAARHRVLELLERVAISDPERVAASRAGELSGGQRQRALIAAAIAARPKLLIADEPTTALDVTVQARIIELLGTLRDEGTGILLISHDLAVVSSIADRALVMRDGRIVERGLVSELLGSPSEQYTRELIAAVPTDRPRGARLLQAADGPSGAFAPRSASPHHAASAAPILSATGLTKSYRGRTGTITAVDGAFFELSAGETLGIVGESGSGKSTLARLTLALTAADAGDVLLDDAPWLAMPERDRRPRRQRLAAIYQDSLSSFDPRWTTGQIIGDAISRRSPGSAETVESLLEQVGLSSSVSRMKPGLLSGGQQQRVSIARALASDPAVIVCDEPVSALDVTIQARILDLLNTLQDERGLAYLFISHDLGVVRHMSDRIAVMKDGAIVETGPSERVFAEPSHPYTVSLLADTPRLRARGR